MSTRVTRLALVTSFSLLGLAGCPGGNTAGGGTGPNDNGKGGPEGPIDQEHAFGPEALAGTYFQPEALTRPAFLRAELPAKLTADAQRKAYKKAKKPKDKVEQGLILAMILYTQSQDTGDLGAVEEAKQLLADLWRAYPKEIEARARAKDKNKDVGEVILLHDLFCLAYDVQDMDLATEALAAAIALRPDDNRTLDRRGYLAYYQIRANQNAEAAATLAGQTADPTQPILSYAIAWAAWRAGDHATARKAILAAAQGWMDPGNLPMLKRDVLIFAARAGASIAESVELAAAVAELTKDEMPVDKATAQNLAFMFQAFKLSGRAADSIALIDKILANKKVVDKTDIPRLHLEQAAASGKLGRSEDLVTHMTHAVEALKACGAPCKDQEQETAKLVFRFGRFSNNLYVTAQDERWYQAGRALYKLYLTIPGIPDAGTVQGEANNLDNAFKYAKKNAGTHDKDQMGWIVGDHAQEVLGCYDRYLQLDPTLGGDLTIKLEIAQSGEVTGATSEPPEGDAGLAAVARCAVESARTWAFPSRTRAGVTRISASYQLQPAKR